MTDNIVPASKAPFPSPFTWHTASYPNIDPTRTELSAKGKVVVITGGAGAIGSAITLGFARAGASTVVLTGRTEKTLEQAVTSIKDAVSTTKVHYYVCDVTDEDRFTAAMDNVKGRFGPISVFVNNAGQFSKGLISSPHSGYVTEWRKNMDVDVVGSLIACRAFIKNAAPNAALINNTSGTGTLPAMKGISALQVSKIANSKLMECISAEHPELFVLNVQPGVVDSALARKAGRPHGMDDVNLPGSFAVWAASPEAKFLNGKYVWSNWDVGELMERRREFEESTFMQIGLEGNSSKGWGMAGKPNTSHGQPGPQ